MSERDAFVMVGAREILAIAGDPRAFEDQIEHLENAVDEESPIAFDLAKALVESTCKTIMTDRALEVGEWKLSKLFKETLRCLQLLPPDRPASRLAHEGLTKVARGLRESVHGLTELRNSEGLASHGPDMYLEPLERTQILLAARSADAIVHFLYKAHKSYPPDRLSGRLHYRDWKDFNAYVDELHEPVQILGMSFLVSDLLFSCDPDHDTYREKLQEFQNPRDMDP